MLAARRKKGLNPPAPQDKGSAAARMGATATKAAIPVTATMQAVNKLADTIGEQIARVTGIKKMGDKLAAATDGIVDRKTTWGWLERAKQGIVSD